MSLAHPTPAVRRRVSALSMAVTLVALVGYVVAWLQPARPWWADLSSPALFVAVGIDLVTRDTGVTVRLLGLACAAVSVSVLLDILF